MKAVFAATGTLLLVAVLFAPTGDATCPPAPCPPDEEAAGGNPEEATQAQCGIRPFMVTRHVSSIVGNSPGHPLFPDLLQPDAEVGDATAVRLLAHRYEGLGGEGAFLQALEAQYVNELVGIQGQVESINEAIAFLREACNTYVLTNLPGYANDVRQASEVLAARVHVLEATAEAISLEIVAVGLILAERADATAPSVGDVPEASGAGGAAERHLMGTILGGSMGGFLDLP